MRVFIVAFLFVCTFLSSNAKKIRLESFGGSRTKMPDVVNMRVDIDGDDIDGEEAVMIFEKVSKAVPVGAYYVDKQHLASMKITRSNTPNAYLYDGSFIHADSHYLFYPSNKGINQTKVETYRLKKEDYFLQAEDLSVFSGESYKDEVLTTSHQQKLSIELYVHVDYSLYVKWLQFTNGDVDKALQQLKYFYIQTINGARRNYEILNREDFSLSISVKTLDVQTKKSLYSNKDITSDKIRIRSYVGLEKSFNFFRTMPNKNNYDAALFIANLDMQGPLGIAHIGGMCSDRGVALVTHLNSPQLSSLISHELGHVLGSEHDKDSYNDCNMYNSFLMSPAMFPLDSLTLNETFKFSSCSISYMQTFIDILNTLDNNCMLNVPEEDKGQDEEDKGQDEEEKLIGEIYTATQQCMLLYGLESYDCSMPDVEVSVCKELICWQGEKKACKMASKRQSGADGTSCGKEKKCFSGVCLPK